MDKVNKQELRRLANAATHDSWYAGNAYDKPFIAKYQVIADTQDGRYVLLEGNQNFLQDAVRNVEFVGAANPAAILSLLDELEKCQKDAMRWQCVRNAIPMQSPYAVWREGSHVVLGKDADDLVDNFLATKGAGGND